MDGGTTFLNDMYPASVFETMARDQYRRHNAVTSRLLPAGEDLLDHHAYGVRYGV